LTFKEKKSSDLSSMSFGREGMERIPKRRDEGER